MKLEEKLLEQYFDVIGKNGNTENQIQEFLEENTIFIPMPFLLNHYLHMNCVISKFNVTIELDDVDITSAETKATYDEIKKPIGILQGKSLPRILRQNRYVTKRKNS